MLMRLRGGMADEADPAAAMGSSPQAYSDGSTFRLQRDGRVEVYRVRLLIPLEGANMGVRAYIYQDGGGGAAATGSEADAIGRMVAADTLQEAARAGIIPARYLNTQSHEIIVEDVPPVTRPVYGPWPEHWYPRQAAEPEAPAAAAAAAATIPVATAVAVEAPAGTPVHQGVEQGIPVRHGVHVMGPADPLFGSRPCSCLHCANPVFDPYDTLCDECWPIDCGCFCACQCTCEPYMGAPADRVARVAPALQPTAQGGAQQAVEVQFVQPPEDWPGYPFDSVIPAHMLASFQTSTIAWVVGCAMWWYDAPPALYPRHPTPRWWTASANPVVRPTALGRVAEFFDRETRLTRPLPRRARVSMAQSALTAAAGRFGRRATIGEMLAILTLRSPGRTPTAVEVGPAQPVGHSPASGSSRTPARTRTRATRHPRTPRRTQPPSREWARGTHGTPAHTHEGG